LYRDEAIQIRGNILTLKENTEHVLSIGRGGKRAREERNSGGEKEKSMFAFVNNLSLKWANGTNEQDFASFSEKGWHYQPTCEKRKKREKNPRKRGGVKARQ